MGHAFRELNFDDLYLSERNFNAHRSCNSYEGKWGRERAPVQFKWRE